MASIICPECKKAVSVEGSFCPKCGTELLIDQAKTEKKSNRLLIWIIAFGCFAGLIVAVYFVYQSDSDYRIAMNAKDFGEIMKAAKKIKDCEQLEKIDIRMNEELRGLQLQHSLSKKTLPQLQEEIRWAVGIYDFNIYRYEICTKFYLERKMRQEGIRFK